MQAPAASLTHLKYMTQFASHVVPHIECPTLLLTCRCKTLDASADGYVRAEAVGCAILLPAATLTPQEAASAVLLRGSAVGQDGRSSSLTAPNGPSQQQAIRAALQDVHEELQLSHLQMHGTGTPLGGQCTVYVLGGFWPLCFTANLFGIAPPM